MIPVVNKSTPPNGSESHSAASSLLWRVEAYRGEFVVCNGILEVFGTRCAGQFLDVADAERFADAMNEWDAAKPTPEAFNGR